MKIIVTFILLVTLTGCASIAEYQQEQHLKLLESAKYSCLEYGFKESTDGLASCIQTEVNEIKNRAAIESVNTNMHMKRGLLLRHKPRPKPE